MFFFVFFIISPYIIVYLAHPLATVVDFAPNILEQIIPILLARLREEPKVCSKKPIERFRRLAFWLVALLKLFD